MPCSRHGTKTRNAGFAHNPALCKVQLKADVEAVGKPQKPAVIALNRGIEPENNYFGQIYTLQL